MTTASRPNPGLGQRAVEGAPRFAGSLHVPAPDRSACAWCGRRGQARGRPYSSRPSAGTLPSESWWCAAAMVKPQPLQQCGQSWRNRNSSDDAAGRSTSPRCAAPARRRSGSGVKSLGTLTQTKPARLQKAVARRPAPRSGSARVPAHCSDAPRRTGQGAAPFGVEEAFRHLHAQRRGHGRRPGATARCPTPFQPKPFGSI